MPELDAAYAEIVAEKRARSAAVVRRGIDAWRLPRPTSTSSVVVDASSSPVFYRFLVTDAPLDDAFRAQVVDTTIRAFGR